MKILRVIESMDPSYGGPCQGIRNSIPELNKIGSVNEVVCMDDEASTWAIDDAFPVYKLGPGKGPWGYAPKLPSWLKANLPTYDVVVVHGLWQYYGYAVRKAILSLKAKGKKVPKFYIMPHGMLDPYFQNAPDRKLKALRNSIFWNLVERKTINSADGLLFTCQEELVLAKKTFPGYLPKREINVGYGILPPPEVNAAQIDHFRQKNNILAEEEYFLFLSRIHPKKGLHNLLSAYASFSQKNEMAPKLVIAGPGVSDEYGQSLFNRVQKDDNLKKKVSFIGMVTGADKWAAFYSAKAFVLPSHQENFGIAVVEALGCKCPVLISNKVNIWREIEEGNGGMVAEDTEEGTVDLLEDFFQLTDAKSNAMRDRAYAIYQNHFTVARAAHRFLSGIKNESV